jgi:hypothetical protein
LRRALSRELYLGRLAARHRNKLPVSRWERLALRKVRLLEKSPPSVTRLGALAQLYPDAVFVHLHRDAPASIGSLIEAWETPSAAHVTGEVAGRTISWMMLTAPGWLDLVDAPIPVRAAFQWRAGIEYVLADLPLVAPRPVLNIAYEQLVADPAGTLLAVLDHCELSHDPQVLARAADTGKRGRTSLSAPGKDKWRARSAEIEPLLPDLAPLRRALGYEA